MLHIIILSTSRNDIKYIWNVIITVRSNKYAKEIILKCFILSNGELYWKAWVKIENIKQIDGGDVLVRDFEVICSWLNSKQGILNHHKDVGTASRIFHKSPKLARQWEMIALHWLCTSLNFSFSLLRRYEVEEL